MCGRRIRLGKTADARVQTCGDALFIRRVFEGNIKGNDEAYVVFFASIHALLAHGAGRNLRSGNAELFSGGADKRLVRIVERDFDVMNADHGCPF